ncbi:MAG: bifunctional molybdenum cofactor biosynthesis protein MoaC/MoaB [Lacipirellulaceae bacterium]
MPSADEPRLSHLDASGQARMVDVGDKPVTDRRAVAEGAVWVGPEVAAAIRANTLVKGDLLSVARLGGVQGAKRASDLILLCHPLALAHIDVTAELDGECVVLRAAVRTAAQTGVEMEALAAVSAAALNVIDMGKSLNPRIEVRTIRVVEKSGGKSGPPTAPLSKNLTVAVLTVSDRRSRGEQLDLGGPAVAQAAELHLGATVVASACVADEFDAIVSQLRAWLNAPDAPRLVLTTGGTGLAPRDVTPEATTAVIERPAPGLIELARARSLPGKPHAFLSRAVAGVAGRTLLVNLPGSPRGAADTVRLLADVLPHAVDTLAGEDGPHPA